MLNAGVLSFDAAGRVKALSVADFPAPFFNGGTPASTLKELVVAPVGSGYTPAVWVGGLPYTVEGALVTDPVGAIIAHVGAVPLTANGVAASTDQTVAYWSQGIPFDANGRIAGTPPGIIINLHAFDSGFDQQAYF
jgi:hypothetical protein